ncbi:MAG: SEC-C domain-containing protein [Planctomycetes bacterium]|nr:SEC-C domain-containing protein [Planctomycetota bacterium]
MLASGGLLRTRVPRSITKRIRAFCARTGAAGDPLYVAVAPLDGASEKRCFTNVERKVARDGGEACLGWALWEWPNVLLEAEVHCVWRDAAGRLLDVSPAQQGDASRGVLFLPDPALGPRLEGGRIDNVREALRSDPAIARLIEIHELLARVGGVAQGALPEGVHDLAEGLRRESNRLADQLNRGAGGSAGRNDPCPCRSGAKFKRCCGR